jgi:Arc/MetJ-type ribon-helix-helix transcriptional regulator
MDISLTDTWKEFVRSKVLSGEFASEQAVIETALRRLQGRDTPLLDGLIDHEFVAFCERESGDSVDLIHVLQATAQIPGSMARSIIEDERADRF